MAERSRKSGGKNPARKLTQEERAARDRKASMEAAEKRTAERVKWERAERKKRRK